MTHRKSEIATPPSWVEIDLNALRANIRAFQDALAGRAEPILVVKADAYGHGDGIVARAAAQEGVRRLAVAHVHEAENVRTAVPEAWILLLGAAPPESVPTLLECRVTVSIVSFEHGRALSEAATRAGRQLPAHIKVDTGMGRLGFSWETAAADAAALFDLPGLDPVGVFTHFARVTGEADDPAARQIERFRAVADALDRRAGRRLFRHASNSRAFLLHPEWDFDGVRPGLALYGYGADSPDGRFYTRPVLQWKTRVVQARRVPAGFPVGYDSTFITPRPTTLAILAVGYADGYPRALSGKGVVLLGGRRCPVLGRVSMNWTAVDAGPDADIAVGEEAVLIGRQGHVEVWADELAQLCDTIPYEIVTRIFPHLPRWPVGG